MRAKHDFKGQSLLPQRCAHDTTHTVRIRISMSQWTHVVQGLQSFVLVNARVIQGPRMTLDTTDGYSGVTPLRLSRDPLGFSMINTIELFAGGFSGWTHALRSLESEGFAFNQFLALDCDLDCAAAYMGSHPVDRRMGPGDLSWTDDELPGSMFVVADIAQLDWLHLLGTLQIHLAMMSPPCPAWSFASNRACGLDRADGQIMLEVWGILSLVRPKVIDMENVSTLQQHPHWAEVLDFIDWCDFRIRWNVTLNLNQVLPQNRDRLLLIASCKEDQSLEPHTCIEWPEARPPTLDDSFVIMPPFEPWFAQVLLSDDLCRIYLDPAMLPKSSTPRQAAGAKRTKLDVLGYRCKFGPDMASCFLANYGFAHELPQHTIQSGGLYGSLLVRHEGLRFFQPHEIAMLMGATQEVFLPMETRKAFKLLGNAISMPHACIALCNTLAYFNSEVQRTDVQDLFLSIFGHRITALDAQVVAEQYGVRLANHLHGIAPTVPLKKLYEVHLHHGGEHVIVHMQIGTCVVDAISRLFHGQNMKEILFMPKGTATHLVPIPDDFRITDFDFHLRILVPIILNVSPKAFHERQHDKRAIIALTNKGEVALHSFPTHRVEEVIHTLQLCDFTEDDVCVDMVGRVLPHHMQTPTAMMILPEAPQPAEAASLQHLYVTHSLDGISFSGSHEHLEDFRHTIRESGLHHVVQALGWNIVVPLNQHGPITFTSFDVVPKHGSMSIVQQDMCNCLLVHLFIIKLRTLSLSGPNANIVCRFKLFGTWIWRGEIDAQTSLQSVAKIWNSLRAIIRDSLGIRFMFDGQLIGANTSLASLLDPADMLDSTMDITLVPGMHGGGPPVELRPASQGTASKASAPMPLNDSEAVSSVDARRVIRRTRSLANIEEDSFSEALQTMFQMWFDLPGQEKSHDPGYWGDLNTFVEDGMLIFQADLENVLPLNRVFKYTGMEMVLDRAGWKVAIQFVQFGRPAKARLLVFPSPVGESMTINAVREFIRACYVTFWFPAPVQQSSSTVRVRAKLWGVRFFDDHLPVETPMTDLYDAWDQASTVVGSQDPYRIVAAGKLTIQERRLGEYIPPGKNPDDPTTFLFLPPQHGGGPAKSDAVVLTKNNLATLLINAGAHLDDLSPFVDQIIQQVGHVAVQQALNTKPAADKWKMLRQQAASASIHFPALSPKDRESGRKIRDKFTANNKDQLEQLIPSTLTIQEGFFTNVDGTNCVQLDRPQPNSCGVVLMTPSEAVPWLASAQKISTDELGIVTLGGCMCEDKTECKHTNIPVYNKAGFPVIVQGVLHQLGQLSVEISTESDVQLKVDDSTVISVTVFKDELDPAKWKELISKPIRVALLLLLGVEDKLDLASPPWGRSFATGKTKAEPSAASSFQFHIRVNAADVNKVLKASGTNGVYTVPKTDDHMVSDQYQVIWAQLGFVEIQVLAANHPENFGIVRNFRMLEKPSRGIRFKRSEFAQAWAKIKPDQELPASVPAHHLYKISPTPKGATADIIQRFCDSQKWKAKPLRAMNSTVWLIGASERIEAVFVSWNGQPLLIQAVQQKTTQEDVLVAGTLPKLQSQKMGVQDNPNAAPEDPWAAWINNHGATGLLANGVKPIPAAVNALPRRVEAPIEDRFQAQEASIRKLRDDTENQLEQMRSDMKSISEGVSLQAARMDTHQAAVETEFQLLRQETSDQFTALAQNFQSSLVQSLQQQDNKIQVQFSELKQLLSDRPYKAPKKKVKGSPSGSVPEDSL
eukprot:Skav219712  [mRNA]  locus=scaffold776:265808:271030:+ [translate_table: standard]